jgi:hypothetical protein
VDTLIGCLGVRWLRVPPKKDLPEDFFQEVRVVKGHVDKIQCMTVFHRILVISYDSYFADECSKVSIALDGEELLEANIGVLHVYLI